MSRRLLLCASLLALAPAGASAQGFGMRVTNEGLDDLVTAAMPRLPGSVSVGPIDRALHECDDGETISASAPAFDVVLGWQALDLEARDGAIVVDVTTDVDLATQVLLDNPWACTGRERCNMTVGIDSLRAEVTLGASTSPDGGISFDGATVNIDVMPSDIELDSEMCSIGDLAEWLFESVQDFALDLLMPLLERKLGEQVSALLEGLFADTLALSIERDQMVIDAWLASLEMTRADGVTVGGDGTMTWTGPIVRGGDTPDYEDANGAPLPSGFAGGVQLAASDRMVNEALYEAWAGGMIQGLIDARTISFDLGRSAITRQLGLSGGAHLDIRVDLKNAPVARFGRSAPNVTEIELTDLEIQVEITPDGGPRSVVVIGVDGRVAAELVLDPLLGGLVVEVDALEIEQLRIDTTSETLELDRARLASFVTRTITPILSGALSGVPVAPALHGFEGTYVHLRSVESADGWQRVGADVHTADPADTEAPDTTIVNGAPLLPAGTVVFEVTGVDDTTPDGLLRYRAWLDGEALFEGEASSVRGIRVPGEPGEHTLEVAAVDLNGNEDPSPASHAFSVDGTPPELAIVDAPAAGIHGETFATVTWTMSDAEGAVEARWELRRLEDDGRTTVVDEAPFADRTTLSVEGLEPGQLYEIEVVARDLAGNVTSESIGFAVDPSLGGCSVGHGGGEAPAALVLFALVGLALRRRR